MKSLLCGLASGLVLTGCASTPKNFEKTVFTGFNAQKNGGQWHGGTGLVCPPTLIDLPMVDQNEYGDQANDASCSYREEGKIATVYLSELDDSFKGVFQNAISAIAQGPFGDKIEVDQEASQACQLGGLLMAAGSKSQDKSIYRFDSAVLKTDELVTLVQLTGLNGKFLKLRYTLLDTPSSEGLNACIEGSKALREVYDLTKSRANDS